MSTKAIDVVTIFHALYTLENEFLGRDRGWLTHSQMQDVVFGLYKENKAFLPKLTNLKAKASVDWQVLNAFLQANRFDPMFDGPLDGIGAVSILDMLVEWLMQASLCEIYSDGQTYPGFEIPMGGHSTFEVDHTYFEWVTALKTKSEDLLWLAMLRNEPESEDLLWLAFSAMSAQRHAKKLVSSVKIPEVDFDLKPDLGFLLGADTIDNQGRGWFISQAYQQFKFRMNKEGAHAKVATGLAMMRGIDLDEPRPLVFNRPFMGWFTQPLAPALPIAIFFADKDIWKKAGDLRSM